MKIQNFGKNSNALSDGCLIRAPHDKVHPYVMISRDIFLDKSISIEAKGLAGYLVSYTEEDVSSAQIAKDLGLDENYVENLMQELVKKGHFVEVNHD